MEFGLSKIWTLDQRRIRFPYADEEFYALGTYLISRASEESDARATGLVTRGREIFNRETRVACHVPPSYTSGI